MTSPETRGDANRAVFGGGGYLEAPRSVRLPGSGTDHELMPTVSRRSRETLSDDRSEW